MSHGSVWGIVGGSVVAYLGFLTVVLSFIVRRRRRQVRERAAATAHVLEGTGSRLVGTMPVRAPYGGGMESEYANGDRRIFASSYAVNRFLYRYNLRIATSRLPWVVVFPEGASERFGKAVGLNREVQTGDKAFDDVAYIDTVEADAPVRQVLDSPAVRDAIRGLLALGYKVQLSEKGVEAFRYYPHGTQPDVSRVDAVVGLLGKLADALPRLDGAVFRGKASAIRASTIAAVGAWIPLLLIGGFLDGIFHTPGARTLHDGPRLALLLGAAITMWLLYVAVATSFVRGHSYALKIVLLVAATGVLGAPLLGIVSIFAANQALDHSAPEEHVALVTASSIYKGKCNLEAASWTGAGNFRVPIPCAVRARYPVGASVHLQVHAGALGMPWFEPVTD